MRANRGELNVWFCAATVALTLLGLSVLLLVISFRGMSFFWPHPLRALSLQDGEQVLGILWRTESEPAAHQDDAAAEAALRYKYKIGNRDLYGVGFRWVRAADIRREDRPAAALIIERSEFGPFFGYLDGLTLPTLGAVPAGEAPLDLASGALEALRDAPPADERGLARLWPVWEAHLTKLHTLEQTRDASSRTLGRKRREIRRAHYQEAQGDGSVPLESLLLQSLLREEVELKRLFTQKQQSVQRYREVLAQNALHLREANGEPLRLPLLDVLQFWHPNTMSLGQKVGFYGQKVWQLLSEDPRESNTEGGLFPAIYGTILMVLLMSFFAIPLGVVAALYLHEYARDGWLVRTVRVAVYNLAGVPSIVFGVFGLGFFVYGVGGQIDRWFFPEALPSPTFGSGGLLWASLTLALLTVPVVIVATEEGLGAIPQGIRQASLALGASQWQTMVRVILPLSMPGILTGFVLSTARAAGEVAPLMLTGVVKLAPALPLDAQAPFLHLERKFMHLGFHIFDVGFQSPDSEAVRPLVYVTTLLLLLMVFCLCALGIFMRTRMRKRFQGMLF